MHLRLLPLTLALGLLSFGCGGGCPSGLALDADGRCAAPTTMDGSVDAGETDSASDTLADPCALCGGGTPLCLDNACVACREDDVCTGNDRCEPVGDTCVACLGDGGDTCPTATPACDTAFHCVECAASADCAEPAASACNVATHLCEGCARAGDCSHLAATPACDVASGTCVECASTADCGGAEGCDPSTHACVVFTPMSVEACEPCVRDLECSSGKVCVAMTYDDPRTAAADPVAVGQRCLWRLDAVGAGAPNGSCTNVEGTSSGMARSVDGVSATVCTLTVSTCEAHADWRVDCLTEDAAGDARCGLPGVNDSICRSGHLCSFFCETNDDCLVSAFGALCERSMSPPSCYP